MKASNTEKSIAHEIGGLQNDTLRFGLHGVKGEITGSHPLQSAYQFVLPLSLSLSKYTYVYVDEEPVGPDIWVVQALSRVLLSTYY
ncbi:hypothetical protein RHMOL_Rhmol10G0084000 [Rhododendron molle]|uniref:Uncharacterized protein n=1 Tax=Rhododendron molle TaxID=49168 RepID=A0ACC0M1Y4_RHOML|nr:hypothetical protein RHMOL_Rhmol10G0084000 [Rhododendron molle]